MFRLFVERKQEFAQEAAALKNELSGFLGIRGIDALRLVNRYDIENITEKTFTLSARRIFSEPASDLCHAGDLPLGPGDTLIAWEYLPGQYDQRADSAEQCLSLLEASGGGGGARTKNAPPRVKCARVLALSGHLSNDDIAKIKKHLINPVDSREASLALPETLETPAPVPADIPVIGGFTAFDEAALRDFRERLGLAMDGADVAFMRDYFRSLKRDPTETEVRILDTYWSDHCRHTTFNTEITGVTIAEGPFKGDIQKSLDLYESLKRSLNRAEKPLTLMDLAVIGAKRLKATGDLKGVEESGEINACSVRIDARFTGGGDEPWLLMFKNETHNHPTEIEPCGGAATCIGGAIRDPLSGRAWVYQSMRVTGSGDPRAGREETLPGKLPQVKITREAAAGFASYGNQIGLATGQVREYYHPGFAAKRMELGAVIAAAPASQVIRGTPRPGDLVLLVGGGTGRDGIGGATGSSKAHNARSVESAACEVQKGNAVEERKLQRLFRNPEVARRIIRCNDFGAGGVSVAVGELAPGLTIDLDAVPKKYEGLDGTELAISESQERMALVVRRDDAALVLDQCARENLSGAVIARVTGEARLV
ncbi:MAG: phosphoribosylformylglycinamidine synthase, partial [Spirochaetaceae bacterium]|nr:phosphoribosylformylglycinamidine synthase [Spirochaetaceae bacterium]